MTSSPGAGVRATREELPSGLRGCVSGVLSLLTICLASAVSVGATRAVAPDGSGDYPTIQAAIDASSSGDVVELLPAPSPVQAISV